MMIKGVAILLATASSALAFSPQNPGALSQKSTVIENTISSSWKMDEPAPEVRSSTWNMHDRDIGQIYCILESVCLLAGVVILFLWFVVPVSQVNSF